MTYTEELLLKADEVIPRVTLKDFNNDTNTKVMIDVRQHDELQASGTVDGSIHVPKGVIEFRLNNNDEISAINHNAKFIARMSFTLFHGFL